MDQYGDLQDFSINYLMRILGDDDEAPIMRQLHGDVLELGTLEEQLPWSGGAGSNYDFLNNDEHMQDEELPTWRRNFPSDDTLQQPGPASPNQSIYPPTAATAASPPPTSELAPLPPSLANPPPGSTATEYSEDPVGSNFCRVLPTIYVGNMVSGGSKAAEIAAPTVLLPEKVAGETSEAQGKTANISAGATKSTDKPALPPVDGDRKRKGKQIIEVDDDSEVPPAKPKRNRTREMHNLVERRRRHNFNEKMNTLFELIPEFIKGSRTRDDRLDKVIFFVRAIIRRYQYLEAERSYHQMMCPYIYMPPAMATPPPPPVLAAAAGLNLGPTFPAAAAAAPIFPPPQAAVMVPPTNPKRTRNREMHNLVERRRRHNSNDKMNNLFKLIPECIEGSRTRGDKLDKAVFSVTALIHKCQYLEAEISYHQMMCPYSYMPPAMATPPPPVLAAAAAGLNLGPTFPATAVYPPAAAAPIFPPPQAAVMVPLEEYQRVQMQQMALMRGCNW